MVLTHGPKDLPLVRQWFVLDGETVRPEGSSIVALSERCPEAVRGENFVHWSLLSDSEREQIFQSVGL